MITNSLLADFFSADSAVLLFSRIPVLGVADFSVAWLPGASAGDGDLLLSAAYILATVL